MSSSGAVRPGEVDRATGPASGWETAPEAGAGTCGRVASTGGAGGLSILPRVFGAILTAMVTPFDADLRVDEAATVALPTTCGARLRRSGHGGHHRRGVHAHRRREGRALPPRGTRVRRPGQHHRGHRQQRHRPLGPPDPPRGGGRGGRRAGGHPYYNRPPRAGIIGHVAAIAEVGVPVVLYNIPGRSGVNMEPDLIAELAQIPNVVALKQANPDLDQCREVARTTDLTIYAGNDDMLFPVLEMGGAGVISVASHLVGEEMSAIAEAARRGDLEEARRRDAALADLVVALFVTTSPILIKAALEMTGLIPSGRLRLPLVDATPVQRDILRSVLERQGILSRA